MRLGLVDVEPPNAARWDYHLVSFEPLPGQVTAPVHVFVWRAAERIGELTDTEEVGRVEWVPLSQLAG